MSLLRHYNSDVYYYYAQRSQKVYKNKILKLNDDFLSCNVQSHVSVDRHHLSHKLRNYVAIDLLGLGTTFPQNEMN